MQLALWNDSEVSPSACAVLEHPPSKDRRARLPDAELVLDSDGLRELADRYLEEAHAANTRRAYQHDWSAFETWCAARALTAMPASTATLELYLAHLAKLGRKASTIRRARIAIGLAHGHAGQPRPDQDTRIRALERGIARTHGAREVGARPLLADQLANAVASLGHSPLEDRDRAILLLGFARGYRSSELAGLNIEDLTFVPDGVMVLVRRSKEDQGGQGKVSLVRFGRSERTCPVRALQAWVERVGRARGPLFRIVRGASIEPQRIHPRAVSRAVQRATARGHVAGHYSAHSLRGGMATSARDKGATAEEIRAQGGWKALQSVHRYIDLSAVSERHNVAEYLL